MLLADPRQLGREGGLRRCVTGLPARPAVWLAVGFVLATSVGCGKAKGLLTCGIAAPAERS